MVWNGGPDSGNRRVNIFMRLSIVRQFQLPSLQNYAHSTSTSPVLYIIFLCIGGGGRVINSYYLFAFFWPKQCSREELGSASIQCTRESWGSVNCSMLLKTLYYSQDKNTWPSGPRSLTLPATLCPQECWWETKVLRLITVTVELKQL